MNRACVPVLIATTLVTWSQQANKPFPLRGGEHHATISLAPQLTLSEAAETDIQRQAAQPPATIPLDIDWCSLPALAASQLPVALPDAIRRFQICSPSQPLTSCRSVSGGGGQIKVCGSVTEFRTRGFIRAGGEINAAANVTPPSTTPGKAAVFSPCNRVPKIPDLCSVTGVCTPGLPVLVRAAQPAVYYPCNDGAACALNICIVGAPVIHKGGIVTCKLVKAAVPAKHETCRLVSPPVLPSVNPPQLTMRITGDRTIQAQLTHTIGGNASIEIDAPMFLGSATGFEHQSGDTKLSAKGKLGLFLHVEAEAKDARIVLEADADSRATLDLDWNSSRGWIDRGRVTANKWGARPRFEEPKEMRLKEAIRATAELEFSLTGRVANRETEFANLGAGFFTGPYLEDKWSRMPNRNFRHDIDAAFEIGAQASLKITDGGFLLPDRHLLDFEAAKDLARGDILDLYGRGDLDLTVRVSGVQPGPIHARLEPAPQTTGLSRHIPATPLEFRNIVSGAVTRFSQHPLVRDPKALCQIDAPIAGGKPAIFNCELVAGDHWLTIDAPSTCSIAGGARRAVRLLPGESVAQLVNVACAGGSVTQPPTEPKFTVLTNPAVLAFSHQAGSPAPAPQTVALFSESKTIAAAATRTGGTAWLSVSSIQGQGPAVLTVSVTPGSLLPGEYVEAIVLTSPAAPGQSVEIPVRLRVTTAATLEVTANAIEIDTMAGSIAGVTRSVPVASNGAALPFTATALGGAWLTAGPANGTAPGNVTVSVNPASLAEGSYTGTVRLAAAGARPIDIPVQLRVRPNRLALAQIADGDSWSTSIVLVNTDILDNPFTIRFYDAEGRALPVDLEGTGPTVEHSGTIPRGGTYVIETNGVSPSLTQGWAEVTAGHALGGQAIFRQRAADGTNAEAAVPLRWPADGPLQLPFDNTQGFVTAAAVLNSDAEESAQLTVTFHDEEGRTFGTESMRLGPRSREAFALAARFPSTAGRRGVMAIASTVPSLGVLGLRFNPRASFTSFEPVAPLPDVGGASRHTISQVADGDGWKTTIVLVNGGDEQAEFSLAFRAAEGGPLAVPVAGSGPKAEFTGTIPPGGSRTIETEGVSLALLQGWADLASTQPLGGTAVFRQRRSDGSDSEATVQIAAKPGGGFVLPFDNSRGFVTAIAALNESDVPVTAAIVFRDEDGTVISNETLVVGKGTRLAFGLPERFPSTAGKRGSAEFAPAAIGILGLRFSPEGAFTSFAPVSR